MPYRAEAATKLAMWRDIERALSGTAPDADLYTDLLAEWARLRLE